MTSACVDHSLDDVKHGHPMMHNRGEAIGGTVHLQLSIALKWPGCTDCKNVAKKAVSQIADMILHGCRVSRVWVWARSMLNL